MEELSTFESTFEFTCAWEERRDSRMPSGFLILHNLLIKSFHSLREAALEVELVGGLKVVSINLILVMSNLKGLRGVIEAVN